jgi:CheY-like chemotaxis protein
MNMYLLGAVVVALLLVLGVALLRRRGPRQPGRDEHRIAPPTTARSPAEPPTPAAPAQAAHTPMAAPGPSVEAQRQAATEALRQARQRKADETARLEAERLAQAEAQASRLAEAQARARTPAPAPAVRPPAPPAVAPSAISPSAISPPTITPPAALRPVGSPPAAAAASAPIPAPAVATPAPPRVTAAPAGPATVLLADDSKVVRVKTGRLLEKQGWRVLLAEDGLGALQVLDRDAPDLLVTDVEMPGLDGFELTRRVRAHPRFARLPVIMITSSDDKHRAEAEAAGVDLLLGKPYAEETLLAQVQRLLGAAARRSAPGVALH